MKEIGPRPAGEHPHPAHWAEIRRLSLERDKGCRGCGDNKRLEVHHRTYERWGSETLDDVTTLCRDCHDLITGAQMRIRDERRRLPTERITVQIERFAPSAAAEIEAPIRALVEVERFPERVSGELPPPGRNVR